MSHSLKQKFSLLKWKGLLVAYVLGLFLAVLGVSAPALADIVPIPVGCPGSTLNGPATDAQKAACATIPLGCPGSTQSGPVAPNFDLSTCPYGVEKAATSNPTTTNSGANCSLQATDPNAKCDVAQDCVTRGADGHATGSDTSAANCGITRYLKIFANVLSGLVGVSVVGVLVVGGIQYSTSAGDPNAAAAARKKILNALLAMVVFALSYGFLQWIVPGGVL